VWMPEWLLVESPAIVCGGTECVAGLVEVERRVQAVRFAVRRPARSANRSPIWATSGPLLWIASSPRLVAMADGFLVTSIQQGTLFARSIASGVYGRSSSSSRRPSPVLVFVAAGEKKSWWLPTGERPTRRSYGGAQRGLSCACSICNEAISSQTSARRRAP